MSDPQIPPVAAAKGGSGRGLRWALAVSVALNLAVAGGMIGAAINVGGIGPRADFARDLGFGPFTEALKPEERDALRKAFFARAPDLRNARRQNWADMAALLAALRAEPFDAAGLTGLLVAQNQRMAGQLALGQALMRDFLIEMDPAARLDFADRLEERLRHRRDRGPDARADGGKTKP